MVPSYKDTSVSPDYHEYDDDYVQVLDPRKSSSKPVNVYSQPYIDNKEDEINDRIDDEVSTLNDRIDIEVSTLNDVDTSLSNRINAESETRSSTDTALDTRLVAVENKIPSSTTADNKLVDTAQMNDAINSMAAFYITKNATGDAFATAAELQSATVFYCDGTERTPTRNDYAIVLSDENHDNGTVRYIYAGTVWQYQYIVNEKPFTQAQLDAINSGTTSDNWAHKENPESTGTFNHGYYNDITGSGSGAIGNDNVVEGAGSFAIGNNNNVTGASSFAIGDGIEVPGNNAFAEGENTHSEAWGSHAEGIGSTVTENATAGHAEGYGSTADHNYTHAEGYGTLAQAQAAHAEGTATEASGDSSHAEGLKTIATSNCSHVQGKYNVEDSSKKFADIVGGGTYAEHKNIEATDWTGNKYLKGTLKVNCNNDSSGGDNIITAGIQNLTDEEKQNARNNIGIDYNRFIAADGAAERAENAEAGAIASATAAATSESNAAISESNAATSESNAATSATNAATSETNASKSASAAASYKKAAATSASNAKTSETNAATSASAAATSESNAATSASNAKTSETNASKSATSAGTSATNAKTYQDNAKSYQDNAATSASNAKTSETNASKSATSAGTSATNALSYKNAAATSASNAKTSETNAATSASAAATSESNAATSASNAATSETNASKSASAAATSATNAKTYQDNAKSYQDNAASYKNAAATSATNAASAAANAIKTLSGTQTTTSSASGGSNVFRFTFPDGTTKDFTVKNGIDGKITSINGKSTSTVTLYGSDIAMTSSNSTKVNTAIDAKMNKNNAEATGTFNHGSGNTVSGTNAFASGNSCKALAQYSHAEGYYTTASGDNQHVQGKYNVANTAYADIIGNGTSSTDRKNIEATDWNGNKYLKGNVFVGCNDDSSGGVMLASRHGCNVSIIDNLINASTYTAVTTTDESTIVSSLKTAWGEENYSKTIGAVVSELKSYYISTASATVGLTFNTGYASLASTNVSNVFAGATKLGHNCTIFWIYGMYTGTTSGTTYINATFQICGAYIDRNYYVNMLGYNANIKALGKYVPQLAMMTGHILVGHYGNVCGMSSQGNVGDTCSEYLIGAQLPESSYYPQLKFLVYGSFQPIIYSFGTCANTRLPSTAMYYPDFITHYRYFAVTDITVISKDYL